MTRDELERAVARAEHELPRVCRRHFYDSDEARAAQRTLNNARDALAKHDAEARLARSRARVAKANAHLSPEDIRRGELQRDQAVRDRVALDSRE